MSIKPKLCDTMECIFVYGSLRKDFWNYDTYLKNSKFIGKGKTKEKYAMYADIIPYIVENEKISHIVGEIYEVDKETLKRIDSLEGHPNCYVRKKVPIILENGKEIKAWMYFYPEPYGDLVKSGDYKEYRERE